MTEQEKTIYEIEQNFNFCYKSGEFLWKVDKNGKAKNGCIAGHIRKDGYRRIRMNGKLYLAHRLVWLFVYKDWPLNDIDHINGNKSENKISNLRDATHQLNLENQKTQQANKKIQAPLGVSWHKTLKKWTAQIRFHGKLNHLGCFATPESAHEAYLTAKRKFHEGCTI